jgi:predicted nucleotide-binding protein
MPVTRLFVGSSSASKSQAKAFVSKFSTATLQFVPWWDAFTAGRILLEDLNSIKDNVQGAVMLFSPEAEATVRGKIVMTPNLNVIFEFGYFMEFLESKKQSCSSMVIFIYHLILVDIFI